MAGFAKGALDRFAKAAVTSGGGGGSGRYLGIAHRVRVRQRQAALGEGAAGLVREAAGDRRRGLGIVLGAETEPRPAACFLAETVDERLHRQRRAELVAAAAPEDAPHQGGGRHHVGRLPGFDRLVEKGVLARPQGRVGDRGGDVGVDPVDVALHVFDRLLPRLAMEPQRHVDLLLQVGFGVGREAPLGGVGLGVGAAEEGGELSAAGVAQHVHQEEAVGRTGITGAEHRVGAGIPVDVRDPVGGVAHDRHPRPRLDRGGDRGGRNAEGRVLEVAGDPLVGQRRRAVEKVFVERLLVGEVRRHRAGAAEGEDLGEGVETVLAGREDVAKAAGVVGSVRLHRRGRRGHPK